ncbi:MAG: GNAT family N-acetyltransferase [Candidatus Thorarchaeota archaeon]|nr:GNAT family N-acetyltransferase [Candidatus Thorarchaeota archaeon]
MSVRTPSIRRATPHDIEAIVQLWTDSFRYHEAIDPRYEMSDDAVGFMRTYFQKQFEADSFFAVACVKDLVVGYVSAYVYETSPVHRERQVGFIDGLFVSEQHRKGGIGTQLYRMAEDWLSEKGMHTVRLGVSALNETGLAFWSKNGFTPVMVNMTKAI